MSFESPVGQSQEASAFESIRKFDELFEAINAQGLDVECRNAYEEAVAIAKELVAAKTKASWNVQKFEDDIARAYPALSEHFVSALRRCVESYNPPVNVPADPLWE